jgi:hypothetical protein
MKVSLLLSSFAIFTVLQTEFINFPTSEWRSNWNIEIELSKEIENGLPSWVLIRMQNQGKFELMGSNLILNLYAPDGMLGWAVHPEIRNKEIKIKKGETISLKIPFRESEIHDLKGKTLSREDFLFRLSGKTLWIRATLSDLKTPKPEYESSFLVWSNMVEFKKTAKKD